MKETFRNECSIFQSLGVDVLYFKELSLKQDNDKNQIYLGSDSIDGIANIFPSSLAKIGVSKSKHKRKSTFGKAMIAAKLNFFWLDKNNNLNSAPNTKIIDYFQYPEVRLSGFLQNCKNPPDALRRIKQKLYGKRILAIGANKKGETYGKIYTKKDNSLFINNFPALPNSKMFKVLKSISLVKKNNKLVINKEPKKQILNELKLIYQGGWHKSIKLNKDGLVEPYKANNGSGYTLEALLDIIPNSHKKPDKYGYEIKTISKSSVSLMTPSADGGEEYDLGFKKFMNRNGWPSKKDSERIVFTGPYKNTEIKNNIKMLLKGYLEKEKKFDATENINLILNKITNSAEISKWSFDKFFNSWETKHANAIYIKNERDRSNNKYKFSNFVYVCHGTSVWRMLEALLNKKIYYDPGHDLYKKGHHKYPEGKVWQRPQWRMSAAKKNFMNNLESLYGNVEVIDLSKL